MRDDLAGLLPHADVVAVDAGTDVVPDVDVLIGTEAVLHRTPVVPGRPVRLVAFLELDQELLAPRARAAEQTLWLLVRAARLLGPRRRGRAAAPDPPAGARGRQAAGHADPLVVPDSERPGRRAWLPTVRRPRGVERAPDAVKHACDALRGWARQTPITVMGPIDDGKRALVRAATFTSSATRSRPEVDAAHAIGRLRVDVDPRRV